MVIDHKLFSLRDQLKLLDLNRSSFYYKPMINEEDPKSILSTALLALNLFCNARILQRKTLDTL